MKIRKNYVSNFSSSSFIAGFISSKKELLDNDNKNPIKDIFMNVYKINYRKNNEDKIYSIVVEAKDVENAKSNFINKNENVKIIDVENILNENDEFQEDYLKDIINKLDVVNDMMIGINELNE